MSVMNNEARPLAGETILVTGAAGFLGLHLLPALRRAGARIVAVSRRPPLDKVAREIAEWISIADWTPDALVKELGGKDWTGAIHGAAYGVAPADRSAAEMANINVSCSAALANLAVNRKAKAYVHVGSSAEYAAGDGNSLLTAGSAVEAGKLYGTSKACGTLISHAIAVSGGMPFAAARLFNLYGPGEARHRLLPTLVSHLTAGQQVPLSPGMQLRDFCFVADVAECLTAMVAQLASQQARSGIYNVCTGLGTTVRSFAECVAEEMGGDAALLRFGAIAMRPDDIASVVGDPTAVTSEFGWSATTSLRAGIRQSLAALAAPGQPRLTP